MTGTGQKTEQARISAEVPDWSREHKAFWEWNPPRSLLASIRAYQRHRQAGGPLSRVLRMVAVLRHRFWSLATSSEIPLNGSWAGGLHMPHPNGIVLHPDAVIGPNCLLMQQVTLGVGSKPGVPRLGGHTSSSARSSAPVPGSWVG